MIQFSLAHLNEVSYMGNKPLPSDVHVIAAGPVFALLDPTFALYKS